MAIVAAVLGVSALIGGLCTYTGVKIFSDAPSTAHVNTIVKNEIAAHIDADNTHESFQNNIITVAIAAVIFVFTFFAVRYAVKVCKSTRRDNTNNNAVEIVDV